jgi:hypothetical protein
MEIKFSEKYTEIVRRLLHDALTQNFGGLTKPQRRQVRTSLRMGGVIVFTARQAPPQRRPA